MTAPIGFLDEGVRDGEAVVLLHGWPTSPFAWRRLTPLLGARFRVIVPELGGRDLAHQARQVAGLLAELGVGRFAAVGHSHGGGVAQILAMDVPGCDALVLIDSIAFDEGTPAGIDAGAFVSGGTVEIADLSEEDLSRLASSREEPPLPLDLGGRLGELADRDLPVMLLWGEDDPYTQVALGERLADAIPGSTLGVVPGSGHFLLEDAFDSVGVLIAEYLRARYLGAPHGHEGLVALQLERRPPWVDLAPYEAEDDADASVVPAEQEVGPGS